MAKNPNEAWPCEHTCYIGRTGSGKSQALRQNAAIPDRARVILWDPQGTQSAGAVVCHDRAAFLAALGAAIGRGGAFRVTYQADMMADCVGEFEWFCSVVWRVLDGRKRTFLIVEELGAAVDTSAKAARWFFNLLTICRKFGLVVHWTSQSVATVPKTATRETLRKVIGMCDMDTDVARMARTLRVRPDQLEGLKPLQFFVTEYPAPARLVTLKYHNPAGKRKKTNLF